MLARKPTVLKFLTNARHSKQFKPPTILSPVEEETAVTAD